MFLCKEVEHSADSHSRQGGTAAASTTIDAIAALCTVAIVEEIEQRCVANRAGVSPATSINHNTFTIRYETQDGMIKIGNFSVFFILMSAFALSGGCITQSDQASETSSNRIASNEPAAVPVEASAVDTESSAMALPIGESSPLRADTFPPPCSICSDFSCQTRSLGAQCELSGGPPGNHLGTCDQLSDRTCSTDGLITCRCRNFIP